jgi:hypothetical protein
MWRRLIIQLLTVFPLILTWSCTFEPGNRKDINETVISDSVSDSFGRAIESTSINLVEKGLGEFLIEFNTNNLTINIYKEPNIDSVYQKLGPVSSEVDFLADEYLEDPELIFNPEDLNFDGYPDIKIPTNSGSESFWYTVFLFDAKKKKFVESEEVSLLTSLKCDSVKKRLYSLDVSGMAGNYYIYNTYRWKNKKLFLERSEKQDGTLESPDVFLRMVLKTRPDSLMDTLAVVRIWKELERERWCIEKGDWRALDGTPFPGENVIRMDGRDGGCY